MKLLILGGTAWLGRAIARAAVERGHDVTCLARGESGAAAPGARLVRADRNEPAGLAGVVGGDWDAVLDLARQPGHVRRAATALAGNAGCYLLVSTVSVYSGAGTPGAVEDAELVPPLAGDVMAGMADYGAAKVACERHVLAAFGPDRTLIARAGLIGGPGDSSDRTGYWPLRFARPSTPDGGVLVPHVPQLAVQVIDVRDLAAWLVGAGERRLAGVFDAVGEAMPLPEHLGVARDVAGHSGALVAAEPAWLVAHGVSPWSGERSLPLWLPWPEHAGFGARAGAAARAAGLVPRPLAQTLADTLAWELTRDPDRRRRAGLADSDERALLEAHAMS